MNDKKIKAILFDLDGTVLNTLDDLADSLNEILRRNGFDTLTTQQVRNFVGNGVAKLVSRALPHGEQNPIFMKCLDEFKEFYSQHMELKTAPYDGIVELLGKLSSDGYALAVVSNKFDGAVKNLCAKYFDGLFGAAVGESATVRCKPAPDAVLKALGELGAQRGEAVYVGDSEVDLLTAKNSGLPCISVTWGFRTREFLEENGAVHLADSPAELQKIIREMSKDK